MSQFSVERFSSHGTENLRSGTLMCFRKFPLSKKFLDKNSGVGGYHDILSEIFCRTVPKTLITEPFCFSELPGIKNFGQEEWPGGEYHVFLSHFFVAQCR